MTLPKVSIITATLNSESTINRAIESVLAQTYSNFEHIIVDACSNDRTIEIVKSYEAQYKGRLKWISENDKGIYDAWNKGVNLSDGDWICFLGSDDVFLPNALELYKNYIENNPKCNFVLSRFNLVSKSLEVLSTRGLPWSSAMKRYCFIGHAGSFHKRELFELNGLFDISYKISGDYELLLRNYNDIIPGFFPDITVNMMVGGVSNTLISKQAKEGYRIRLKYHGNKLFCIYMYLRGFIMGNIRNLLDWH